MTRSVIAGAAVLAFSLAAAAQDYPKADIFLGYTYTRFNSAGVIPAFNANGGSGQFAYNFTKRISGVVDLGAVNVRGSSLQLDTTVANFLAGPRVPFHWGRFTPYVQTLFGGAYATSSSAVPARLI